jgi:hypothetical protein
MMGECQANYYFQKKILKKFTTVSGPGGWIRKQVAKIVDALSSQTTA